MFQAKTAKIAFLISLGLFLADVSSARIWIGKNGNKIDAEFVKYDPEAKTVAIRQGDIEHKVAFDNLGEEDQRRSDGSMGFRHSYDSLRGGHSLNSSPDKYVSIMSLKPDAREFAIIRFMQK